MDSEHVRVAVKRANPATIDPAVSRTYTYERPALYPLQEAAIFQRARTVVIEASTKSGKTVGCMAWLLEQALSGKQGDQFWWLAPYYTQSRIAYERYKTGLPPQLYQANDSDHTLNFPNGALMRFRSGEKPDALYGDDVKAMVIDEGSRFREEAWHAARSTLTATRGPIRIIGNVRGRKNWFYRLARQAESGQPDLAYAKITWRDAVAAGVMALEEIEEVKRRMPEHVFKELYEAEPSDESGNPLGDLTPCIGPLSDQPAVCWGWDLAKSVDWTVGVALDQHGHVCRIERWQRPWKETIRWIEHLTVGLPALVDSTGVGDPILEALQRSDTPIPQRFEGFKFTSASKQQLMEGLAVAIQNQEIRVPEGIITQEHGTFGYEITRTGVRYAAAEGCHDDSICALALAVQCWRGVARVRVPLRFW